MMKKFNIKVYFFYRNGFHTRHADQENLLDVYKSYKPNTAIPIHGSVFFFKNSSEFIEKNFPEINTRNNKF